MTAATQDFKINHLRCKYYLHKTSVHVCTICNQVFLLSFILHFSKKLVLLVNSNISTGSYHRARTTSVVTGIISMEQLN